MGIDNNKGDEPVACLTHAAARIFAAHEPSLPSGDARTVRPGEPVTYHQPLITAAEVRRDFGLMGGGYGPYVCCDRCGFFGKCDLGPESEA